MNGRTTALALSLAVLVTAMNRPAVGFNQPTHRIINEEAVAGSTLDSLLKIRLGVLQGVRQEFNGRTVTAWAGEGGIREDDGVRFFRHFHDPLKSWATSGLVFLGQHQPSILWMQRATECQDWTWSAARCLFYGALTAASPGERDEAWAETFRAVGQLMHLVVDASVPEHTRNDPHPLGGLFGSYEYWAQTQHGRPGSATEAAFIKKYLEGPVLPDLNLLARATNEVAAPIPVAHLIDSKTYRGIDPNATLTAAIGIAEFSNANFFSEDSGYRRFLAPDYPHPVVERLVPTMRQLPTTQSIRAYYKKGADDGLAVDPVLAECALDAAFRDDGIPTPQYKCMDQIVWQQTALAMLPRAVGYAATLIDYFFRGSVGGMFELQNLTISGSTETMDGTFRLLYDTEDGTRSELASWVLRLEKDGSQVVVAPQLPPDVAPTANCWLIFRGQLGDEPGAVVGAKIGCPQAPTPSPEPSERWTLYSCTYGAYGSPTVVRYRYATVDPPLAGDGLAMPTFYLLPATGEAVCSLVALALPAQPPGSVGEHPF
jgi:hypothetical protein